MHNPLFVALLLACFFLKSAAAASPIIEYTIPTASMSSSFYPDPEGMLVGDFCELCQVSFYLCTCTLSRPPHASTITSETLLLHPEWPRDAHLFESLQPVVATPAHHYPTRSYADNQSLQPFHYRLEQHNEDDTVMSPHTVHQHVLDTYNAGDRTVSRPASSPRGSRLQTTRRQPARPGGGFRCIEENCGEGFNRSCDLKRHQKKHMDRSERPHKCRHCNEGFIYPKDRARHEKTHDNSLSSQPQLYCDMPGCSNTDGFSRPDNLMRHRRNKHPHGV